MKLSMRTLTTLWVVVMTGSNAVAQKPVPEYVPAETTVCVMPVMNKSGEKSEKQNADQAAKAHERLVELFKERHFVVMPDSAAAEAQKRLEIDLTDEENYNRATLYRIGKDIKADLIVFAVITNVEQNVEKRWTGERKQGRATVKMWFLDVRKEKAILSAVSKEASVEGALGWDKGSKTMRYAAAKAAGNALSGFFEQYPKK